MALVKGEQGVEIFLVRGVLQRLPGRVHSLADKLLLEKQHLVALLQLRGRLGPVADILGPALAVLQNRADLLAALGFGGFGNVAGLFLRLGKDLTGLLLAVAGDLADNGIQSGHGSCLLSCFLRPSFF